MCIEKLFEHDLVADTKARLAELGFTFDKRSLSDPLSILDDHKLPHRENQDANYSGYIEFSDNRTIYFESYIDTYCGYLMLLNSFVNIKNIQMSFIYNGELIICLTHTPSNYREYLTTFNMDGISDVTFITVKLTDFDKYNREISPDLPVTSFPAPPTMGSYGPIRRNRRCNLSVKKAEKVSDAVFAKEVYKDIWYTRARYHQIRDEILNNRPVELRGQPITENPLVCDDPELVKDYHSLKSEFLRCTERPEWDKNVRLNIEDNSSFEWADGYCCCSD